MLTMVMTGMLYMVMTGLVAVAKGGIHPRGLLHSLDLDAQRATDRCDECHSAPPPNRLACFRDCCSLIRCHVLNPEHP